MPQVFGSSFTNRIKEGLGRNSDLSAEYRCNSLGLKNSNKNYIYP
jgi:hypothetical protein